jgi:hypothetical protein
VKKALPGPKAQGRLACTRQAGESEADAVCRRALPERGVWLR